MIGPYKRSKFMAEQVAIEAARSGVEVVIVNPTTPVGDRDINRHLQAALSSTFSRRSFRLT
jgi:dihydroflavonol-4-reductase